MNCLMIKIKQFIDNQMLQKNLVYLPPLIGVSTFTLIVYFFENKVSVRLPIYQGVSSVYALIMIPLYFNQQRLKIKGIILKGILFITLGVCLFYFLNGNDLNLILSMITINLIVNIVNFINVLNGNKVRYLIFLCLNSLLLPLSLFLEYLNIYLISIILIIINLQLFREIFHKLEFFEVKDDLLPILKSLISHIPFLLFPILDFKLVKLIDYDLYKNYVLLFKYINGFFVLVFSKIQLDILIDKGKKLNFDYKKKINIILIIMFFLSYYHNKYVLIIIISLYSIGINIMSIEIRNLVFKNQKHIVYYIPSLLFIGLYYIILENFAIVFYYYPYIFIFLIFTFTYISVRFIDLKKANE